MHRSPFEASIPAAVWWQNAVKFWEIAFATPQVIALRAARFGVAGPFASGPDGAEAVRMVQEKAVAFLESWAAMASQTFRVQQDVMVAASQQWLGFWSALAGAALPRARAPIAMSRRAKVQPTFDATRIAAVASRGAARVAARGLAPVHRRATSNARRLSRSKRR